MIKAILCSVLILFFTAGCKVVDEPKKEKPTEEQKVIDLFTAVNDGKINDVNKILKKGDTDVNGYNELGQTPVMVAVLSESPLIATALIKAGAKIYKPEKNDATQSAVIKVKPEQIEIKRVFGNKIAEYQTKLESLISRGSYTEAMNLYKSDFIPVNFKLLEDKEPLRIITSKIEVENNEAKLDFIKYLLEESPSHRQDVSEYEEQLIKYASVNQEVDLLTLTAKAINEDTNISFYEFETDPNWLIKKQQVMNEVGRKNDFRSIEQVVSSVLISNQGVSPKLSDFLGEVFKSKNTNREVNKAFLDLLKNFSEETARSTGLVREVSESIDRWNEAGLSKMIQSRDELLSIGIRITESSTDVDSTKNILDQFWSLSSQQDSKLEESFKAVLSSSQERYIKEQIFRKIYSFSGTLPEGTLSEALKTDTSMLQFILSNGFNYNKDEQSEVLRTAIEFSSDGSDARSHLSLLGNNGISFGSEAGVGALEASFEKLWSGERSYQAVVSYLVSDSVELVNYSDDERIVSILKSHLEHIRKSSSDLDLVSLLLEKLKRKIKSEHFINRAVFVEETPYKIKASLVWDYILSVHELHRNGISEYEPMLIHLDKLLEVFSESNSSMSDESAELSGEKNLPHSMLGLTLMVLLKDELVLNEEDPVKRAGVKLVWDTTVMGESSNLSQVTHLYGLDVGNKEFWVDVLRRLVRFNRKMPLADTRASSRLIRALLKSDLLTKYPELSDYFGDLKITENQYSRVCNYRDSSAILQGDAAYNLGSFNALWDMKDKTCMNSTQMTEFEISFIEKFIRTNLSEASSGSKSVTEDVMELDEIYKKYNLNQFNVYSNLGVLQNALFNPRSFDIGGVNKNVTPNIYSPSSPKYVSTKIGEAAAHQTKLNFLGDWEACAEKISDSKLSDLFLRLKDIYDIEPYPSYGRWKYCRWKGK